MSPQEEFMLFVMLVSALLLFVNDVISIKKITALKIKRDKELFNG